MAFACSALTEADVRGQHVLEAGAFDVNGSVRGHVEGLGPASYMGTDMRLGPGVDVLCTAEELPSLFNVAMVGPTKGVVISTEMLEHAADWQAAMHGMITALRPGGVLVLTTRSAGFPVHGYPDDHWRFPVESMRTILGAAGLTVERCEPDPDPASPGVFAKARKPDGWTWPYGLEDAWAAVHVDPVNISGSGGLTLPAPQPVSG
jgi:SAM-dependent methyltransferase